MRVFVATLSFVLTLILGLNCAPRTAATIYEKAFPSYTKGEAQALLGKRVRNVFYRDNFTNNVNVRCDSKDFLSGATFCEQVAIGKTGEVIGITRFSSNGYTIVIKWDDSHKSGETMYTNCGRFTSRVFLEFEK